MRWLQFRPLPGPARIHVADGWLTADEAAAARAACAADPAPRRHDDCGESLEADASHGPLAVLARRIDAATGVPNGLPGTLRYRHYRPGEAHPPQHDHYRIGRLHLVLTAMIWLEAPTAGGETRFPAAGVALPPVAGRLALWENCLADGRPDPASWHEALPVLAGDKITLTAFIYAPRVVRPAFAEAA